MEIRYGTRRFPVHVIENPGTDNNCLGYALGRMLKGEPADLRDALCDYLEASAPYKELCDSLTCSILDDHFETVPEDQRFAAALHALRNNCFIPADVFVSFCKRGPSRRRLLNRYNVVFFAERDGYYEPVTYHLDDISRPTQYVGCDNTHYEALKLNPRHMLQFDVTFFGL